MKRRKFIQIMAASSAMMAANPFALVSPRPPIVEGGKYRITMTDGGGVDDVWLWHREWANVPGIKLLDEFESESTDREEMEEDWSPEQKKWIQDSFKKYGELNGCDPNKVDWDSDHWLSQLKYWPHENWLVGDVILQDKAVFRHSIVMEMEKTIREFKSYQRDYESERGCKTFVKTIEGSFSYPNMGIDHYEDHYPFQIRNIMIACGLINDKKLWDWFRYHPVVHLTYPSKPTRIQWKTWGSYSWETRTEELFLYGHWWDWDHLWVPNDNWGPASIQKIG